MKEQTTKFELTQETKTALLNAVKGNYNAQARAVIEGYRAGVAYKKIGSAIRDALVDGKKLTCGHEAILGGLEACRVNAVNGAKLTEEQLHANVAAGMEQAEREHAAKVAQTRKDNAEKAKTEKAETEAREKAAREEAEKAAACRKASDLFRAKVTELEAWIADAQVKLVSARNALEKALTEEAEETSRNIDQLTAFYTSAGLQIPANLAEIIDTPEVQADLALAKKHAEFLAGVALAKANAEKAKAAEAQAAVATPAPIPEKDDVGEMLAERAASMDAAIDAARTARRANKAQKVA